MTRFRMFCWVVCIGALAGFASAGGGMTLADGVATLKKPGADAAERLKAIAGLEALAKKSPKDQPAVVIALCAFITAELPAKKAAEIEAEKIAGIDPLEKRNSAAQAALLAIARRKPDPMQPEAAGNDDPDTPLLELGAVDLRGADFGGGRFEGANFEGSKLEGAKMRKANLGGAFFEGADLRGADLSGANLEGCNLRGDNMEGANLTGANLKLAEPWKARLRGAKLKGANLEGSDLRDADLRGADLSGANFKKTEIEGAQLQGANLKGAKGLAAGWDKKAFVDASTVRP